MADLIIRTLTKTDHGWGIVLRLSLYIALTVLLPALSSAQLNYVGGTLTDDLNSLPTANEFTFLDNWEDNVTATGWYRRLITDGTPGVENRFRVDDGGATGGSLWSLGEFGSVDRALGFTNSTNIPAGHIAVCVVNLTGATIATVTIKAVGEQWREGAAGTNIFAASHQLNAVDIVSGSWTGASGLDFRSIHENGPAQKRNGNLIENRALLQATLTNLDWQAGDSLWIRWSGADRPSPDHTLAIDDFALTAVPEPSLLMVGLAGLLLRRRRTP